MRTFGDEVRERLMALREKDPELHAQLAESYQQTIARLDEPVTDLPEGPPAHPFNLRFARSMLLDDLADYGV